MLSTVADRYPTPVPKSRRSVPP
ncbi:hypothetical protein YPPY16_2964, partial [Yersinia pestis PY-16]